ncbi:MFS transporter [Caballeronia sp. DA-9]|uniref:MFS transporter n=1 Tax=Caballeronia sp. DA-9 TaxID=3436237 RepID=UPI003F67FF6D
MENSFDGAAGLKPGSVGQPTRDAGLLPATEAERAALLRRAVFASLVGTAVEWYDYFIFATASTLVFGKLFFPGSDPMIGAIKAFAVFGVGFFVRPLGGIFFGDLGDRYGRKKALVFTFMLMGMSTFLIGLLPTTHGIGLWSPILLVILRLCQGFGVGGEWGGASLVAVEYAPKGKRGMYGSVPQIGNAIGLVAATGAFAMVSRLPREDMMSWGWRVPFLFSIVLVAVGLFIRFRLTETPAFLAAQEAAKKKRAEGLADDAAESKLQAKLPITILLRHFYKPLLLAMGMRLGEAFFGYLILTIGLAYASHYTTVPTQDILWAGTIAAAGGAFTYWAFGALSDKIGRRGTFIIGAATGIVMAFPFFWILKSGNIPLVYLAYFIGYSVGVGATYAVEPSFFAELFGTKVRYTGISLAAQIPSILVGLWPMASAALLVWSKGDPWPLAAVTAACVFIGGLCAWIAPETNRADLTQLDHDA